MNKLIALSLVAGVMMFASSSANAATIGLVNANVGLGTIHGNDVSASANTGANVMSATNTTTATSMGGLGLVVNAPVTAASSQQQLMFTGNATAGATQFNQVNGGTCGCLTDPTIGLFNLNVNAGSIAHNDVSASANTGANVMSASNMTAASSAPAIGLFVNAPVTSQGVQLQQMQTGAASAGAAQWNYVN